MNHLISASILSADFRSLENQIRQCEDAGIDWIHIDVMDGHFVPNLTMGPFIVETCRKITSLPLDCHLMVEQPENLVQAFASAGANYITIHPEKNRTTDATLLAIRRSGCNPGIALNPGTNASKLDPFLDLIDMVLVMTVNPGYSGQSFMPEMIQKVKTVSTAISVQGRLIRLEVDGGISSSTIKSTALAGADTFVSASAIFNNEYSIAQSVDQLREALIK